MPQPKLSVELAQEAVDAWAKCGNNACKAAEMLGLPRPTFEGRLRTARVTYKLLPQVTAPSAPAPIAVQVPELDTGRLRAHLTRGPSTLAEMAESLGVTEGAALDACNALRNQGHNLYRNGEHYSIERTPVPVERSDDLHVFESDAAGHYRFGFVTDNHLGSKYAREDVLNDLYDMFAAEGVTRVYNAGNWIDGESHFNKFDLKVHGMSAQVRYFCEKYPQRPGITTYYVAGDDHEGWYAQKHGIDIGRYAQQVAQDEFDRSDLRYLGYMESFIEMRHAATRASCRMLVMHPGGGSSYAVSYAPQKIVESFEGGEKPAVLLLGHYHKMHVQNDRNVWVLQGGTTEDQTPFMRKKKLQAHVGGMLVDLYQDERGAITECIPRMRRYFDRGYYNGQFNPSGPLLERGAA